MAMPHVQMLGSLDLGGGVYLLTKLPTPTLPLEGDRPDLVVMPARGVAPTAFAPRAACADLVERRSCRLCTGWRRCRAHGTAAW